MGKSSGTSTARRIEVDEKSVGSLSGCLIGKIAAVKMIVESPLFAVFRGLPFLSMGQYFRYLLANVSIDRRDHAAEGRG
jgi:hypothetical protein